MAFVKVIVFLCLAWVSAVFALPKEFVYLRDIDPTILQDMRYAGTHNFTGQPVPGYQIATCILTKPAAVQLKKIQEAVRSLGYSLKVYDCYRPQQAVDAFIAWSHDETETMKAEFYPDLEKKNLFKLGYIAEKSGHSRGSTVDLTMVKFPEEAVDMGTEFDYFNELSHSESTSIPLSAYLNRMQLRYWMMKYHFMPLAEEWWHFTLKDEPFPVTYFNFVVE